MISQTNKKGALDIDPARILPRRDYFGESRGQGGTRKKRIFGILRGLSRYARPKMILQRRAEIG